MLRLAVLSLDTVFHHCFGLCDSVIAHHWLNLQQHLYSWYIQNTTKKSFSGTKEMHLEMYSQGHSKADDVAVYNLFIVTLI